MKKLVWVVLATFIFSIIPFVDEANSQRRAIRRAIQKNIRIAIKRQLLKLRIEHSAGAIGAMDISADGRFLIAFPADGSPRLWNLNVGRQVRKFPKRSEIPEIIRFSPDGQSFAFASNSGRVEAWGIASERPLIVTQIANISPQTLAYSGNGSFLAIADTLGALTLMSAKDGTVVRQIRVSNDAVTAMDIGRAGQLIAIGDAKGKVSIIEVSTGTKVGSFELSGAPITGLRFGRDETEVLIANGGRDVSLWRVGRQKAVAVYESGSSVVSLDVAAAQNRIVGYGGAGEITLWSFDKSGSGQTISKSSPELGAVRFDHTGNKLVSGGADGLVKFWEIGESEPKIKLVSTTRGWAVVGREGRYDGSDKALRNVQWVTDTSVLPIDNFKQQFHEPGLLLKARLGQIPMMTSANFKFGDGILPPPETFISLPEGRSPSRDRTINVKVVSVDKGGGITNVRLYHNGRYLPPPNIVRTSSSKEGGFEIRTTEYRVRMIGGNNRLFAVSSSTENIIGPRARAELTVDAPLRAPVLHVLAVGLNNYKDPELNLNYAVPDAEGLIGALKTKTKKVFSELRIRKLYNQEATRDGIINALRALRNTDPEDVVIIYMASHGEAIEDEFYILPYEFPLTDNDSDVVKFGLSSTMIRDELIHIGARRIILLLDACKSGTAIAVLQDYIHQRAIRRLGGAVGMHIVSATDKEQFAVELKTLGHGVFTYSVIEALSGKADREPSNGILTISELISYAEEQVPLMSQKFAKYRHWPTVFSQGVDFTISE